MARVLLLLALAGCATGVVDQDVAPTLDAGGADTGSGATKDAAVLLPDAGVVDAAVTPPAGDSGTTTTSCTPYSGALAAYAFANEPGNQASTPASSVATGVTAGDLTRSAALTANAGAGSINASNWTTSSTLDSTRYFTFKLTAPSGCSLDLGSIPITTAASKTGPTSASVATSDDAFAKTVAVSVGGTSTPALSVSGATGAVEIRVYGFAAATTAGTLRLLSTLTISGSLQ